MFHSSVFLFLFMFITEIAVFQRKGAKLLSQKGHLQRLEAHLQRKVMQLQRLESGVLPLETRLQRKVIHPFWFGTAQKGRLERAFCKTMRVLWKGVCVVREMFYLQPLEG
jgi:hypothetical protein